MTVQLRAFLDFGVLGVVINGHRFHCRSPTREMTSVPPSSSSTALTTT
jgi:hypothetical protein